MARHRLTLHAGLHKTGTTTLQRALHASRDTLAAQGVFYPDPPEGTAHNRFFRPELAHELGHALAAFYRSECARLLLSAEDLASHFLRPDRAEAIRSTFARAFEIDVVIYLRRQDRLKESVYAEIVKRGFTGPIEADDHYELDFLRRLDALAATFGAEALRVRTFREDRADPGWLVRDFCTAAALDPGAVCVPAQRHNAALHRRKTLLLSEMPVGRGLIGREFVRHLAAAPAPEDDGMRFLASPETHRALLEAQAANNATVATRYGLPEPLPEFEITAELAAWRPPAPIRSDERAAVLASFVSAETPA